MFTDFLPKAFEHLLPQLWRTRPASNPDRNDATLSRVSDTDGVYRAIMDHAYQLLEQAGMEAIQPGPVKASRDFMAGRAFGLAEFIQTVESIRRQARELELEKQRRLEKRLAPK